MLIVIMLVPQHTQMEFIVCFSGIYGYGVACLLVFTFVYKYYFYFAVSFVCFRDFYCFLLISCFAGRADTVETGTCASWVGATTITFNTDKSHPVSTTRMYLEMLALVSSPLSCHSRDPHLSSTFILGKVSKSLFSMLCGVDYVGGN